MSDIAVHTQLMMKATTDNRIRVPLQTVAWMLFVDDGFIPISCSAEINIETL